MTLPDSERVLLAQAQRACRNQAGYVPVTVLLIVWSRRMVRGVSNKDTRIFSPFGIDKFVRGQSVQALESFGKIIGT